jgi:hypothetical protein
MSSNVVTVEGTLLAGAPSASCEKFPGVLLNTTFELTPANKVAKASTYQARELASPGSFVTLDGIGTGKAVSQATFLYLRTKGPLTLRITMAGSPDVVSVVDVEGLFIHELPSLKYIKLLEAQGTGVFEYFASGPQ